MKLFKILLASLCLSSFVWLANLGTGYAQSAPLPAAPGSNLEQRVNQRKKERNIQLDPRNTQRLTSACVNAQSVIRRLQPDITTVLAVRPKVYAKVDAKLWIAIGQLKLAEQDTFKLEEKHTTFVKKVQDFQVAAANYKQTLDDIVVVNCGADIVGFKALVDTARLYHNDILTRTTDIRNYVIDDIKPAINTHDASLKPNSPTEGE